MEVRKLTCPSCGAQLDIPPHLSRAHCMYCGSELVVQVRDEEEVKVVETHLQLGWVAWEAENFPEALEHFSKALEADPNNVDAWVKKAMATLSLDVSAGGDERLDEALRYMDKALELASGDVAVVVKETKETMKRKYSAWLNILGNEEMKLAAKIMYAGDPRQKGQNARHVRKAVEHYRRAIALNPTDPQFLKNMAYVLSHEPGGGEYGDPRPYEKAAKFLEERETIRAQLIALREEQCELEQQKQRGGFGLLDRRRGQYSRVKKRIAELESLVEAAAALGIDTDV